MKRCWCFLSCLILVVLEATCASHFIPYINPSQLPTKRIIEYIADEDQKVAIRTAAGEGSQAFQAFLDEYWLSRDPTPGTILNEYRNRFEGRFISVRDSLVAPLSNIPDARIIPWVLYGPPAKTQVIRHRDDGAVVIWLYQPSFLVPMEAARYATLSDLDFTFTFLRNSNGRHSLDTGNMLDDVAGGRDRVLPFLSHDEIIELITLLQDENEDPALRMTAAWRLQVDPQPETLQALLTVVDVRIESVRAIIHATLHPLTVRSEPSTGEYRIVPVEIDTSFWNPGYGLTDEGKLYWIGPRVGLEPYTEDPDSLIMDQLLKYPYNPKEKVPQDVYNEIMQAALSQTDLRSKGWLSDEEADSLYSGVLGTARSVLAGENPMAAHILLEPFLRDELSRDAEAWHLDAIALLESAEAGGRQQAENCVRKALRLDTGNLRYRITLARILSRRTFDTYADIALDKLLKDAPSLADAYALKARIRFEIIWKVGWRAGGWGSDQLKNRYTTSPNMTVEALSLLNRALLLDPDNEFSTWWLGTHYILTKRWIDVVPVMTYLIQHRVHLAEAYLGRGLAYQHLGMLKEASEDYKNGLDLLPSNLRVIADDPRWSLPASQGGITLERLADTGRRESEISPTIAGNEWLLTGQADRNTYWRGKDPLFSSDLNERMLEQYRRFAHVCWHYAVPNLGLRGWDTHSGRIYLRYGEPLTGTVLEAEKKEWEEAGKSVPGIFSTDESALGSTNIVRIEYWYYDGFRIPFMVGLITGNRSVPRPQEFDVLTEVVPESPHVMGVRTVLPIETHWYYFERADEELEFSVVVELPDLVPDSTSVREIPTSSAYYSLLDNEWNEIIRRDVELPREILTETPGGIFIAPPLRLSADLLPSLIVYGAFEIMPPSPGSAFAGRDTLLIPRGNMLRFSSLIVANEIVDLEEAGGWSQGSYITRGGYAIRPSPVGGFVSEEGIYLYFEIYGLSQDEYNATRYQLALEIRALSGQIRSSTLVETLGRLIGREQREGSLSLLFDREGIGSSANVWNRIVFPPDSATESYLITVEVTDLVSGAVMRASIPVNPLHNEPPPAL